MKKIIFGFTGKKTEDCRLISGGHINRTWAVTAGGERFILQKLNDTLFDSRLQAMERDYLLYVRACGEALPEGDCWEVPRWLKDRQGDHFHRDDDGGIWRCYPFIPGQTADASCDSDTLKACGAGLAKLHHILSYAEGEAAPVLPDLHNTAKYHDEYLNALKNADEKIREPEAERIIDKNAESILSLTFPGRQLIHGDARIGNALFRNSRQIAMLDLDSSMYGPRLLDIADCMRSASITDAGLDRERCGILLEGYQTSGFRKLSPEELDALPAALSRICFELGLRYYTDRLRGNIYFPETRPGENAEKARKYLRACI